MDELLLKLRILARAEITLAQISAQRIASRVKLYAIAIGALLLTVVMVNVGAYQLLAETYSQAAAAFWVAAGNGALAITMVVAASQFRPGPEEHMVREIREMALAELTADVDAVEKDFKELSADVKRIRNSFTALTSGGGGFLGDLGSILSTLLGAFLPGKKK